MTATINNVYRDGAAPELLQQAYNQAAFGSTHSASSVDVVCGKYVAGSPDSYEAVAQARGATYFSMSDWNAVQGQMGVENMWNINKAFLYQQMAAGKTFLFTANPATENPNSYASMEFDCLKGNGYGLTPDESGYYHATRK